MHMSTNYFVTVKDYVHLCVHLSECMFYLGMILEMLHYFYTASAIYTFSLIQRWGIRTFVGIEGSWRTRNTRARTFRAVRARWTDVATSTISRHGHQRAQGAVITTMTVTRWRRETPIGAVHSGRASGAFACSFQLCSIAEGTIWTAKFMGVFGAVWAVVPGWARHWALDGI